MNAPRSLIDELAVAADEAARTATAIAQFTHSHDIDPVDAYAVQRASVERRLGRGERLVGIKMGLTSKAKMAQVGVDEVIWGRLTDGMRIADGDTISLDRFVHPRLEPEVAFLIGEPLGGAVSAAEARQAVAAVAPAAELIDSRFENFQFSLPDVVADNSSSSGFIVGDWCPPDSPIDNLGMVLERNGRPAEIGSSAAILGNPIRSLVEASRMADEAGLTLQPGWIVLAGGATAAVPLQAGDRMRVVVEALGSVHLAVAP